MDESDRILLEGSPLFFGVELDPIEHLLTGCPELTLTPGDTLLKPGAQNNTLYLVLGGQLRVYLNGRDLPEHTQLNSGDCAGEISVIDGRRVSALVIAAEDTRLLAIDQEIIWSLVDMSYVIAHNLLKILSGRIRHNNLALVSSQRQGLYFESAPLVDSLTGLHNKRWVEDAFPRAISRCVRDGVGLCLLLGDLDNFKSFNNTHGNLIGDHLLRMLARRLADILRPQDMLARYGVEEFIVLLPETDISDALKITERMRIMTAETQLPIGPEGNFASVTMSFGIVPMLNGDMLDDLIVSAETCLKRAKDAGRNRVEIAKRSSN